MEEETGKCYAFGISPATLCKFLLGFLLLYVLLLADANAFNSRAFPGVCFYNGAGLTGQRTCAPRNRPGLSKRHNDQISSFYIPKKRQLTVFTEPNYQGDSATFTETTTSLAELNNRISSFIILKRSQLRKVCFYRNTQLRSLAFCTSKDKSKLSRFWNDAFRSVHIPEGFMVTVYEHKDYQGESRDFVSTSSSLDDFERTISSFRIHEITTNDVDQDGVEDTFDNCPNTLQNEAVDAQGCSATQLDEDNDGVADAHDICLGTLTNSGAVDTTGCASYQRDTDGDGITDDQDVFPNDHTESTDLDGDGVGDNADPDRDGDGVINDQDVFPNDATETTDLDNDGIGDNSDTDRDGDGVVNAVDVFPNDATETSDLDGDGIGDNLDTDRDGDGADNTTDAFPDDATEFSDLDGDGTGDNADPDRDGDGVANEQDIFPNDGTESTDLDGDGIGDNSDPDRDGDGVNNDQDAFPNDATETIDTDGDGIGNNTDPDIDGDGVNNTDDLFPNDVTESTDLDGDGIGDNSDPDRDGDGTVNTVDAFPDDATESSDLDNDGIGDNVDSDRDGDGVKNENDAFPGDPTESTDLDSDGVGDNSDPDRDGDGTVNEQDAFPNDASESTDTDGDGVGDNTDTDLDGDGVPNTDDTFPTDPTESADLDGDSIGDNTDPDRDGDGVINEDDYFPDDSSASSVPTVRIVTPSTLTTVGASPIIITGTLDTPDASLTLNGVPITTTGGTFTASVTLEEGLNTIIARAVDGNNNAGTASISVSLDKTPPTITIQAPEAGSTLTTSTVNVSGLVNDIVRGTITDQDAVVHVNGIAASVSNRSYLAENVPLTVGTNTLNITASDAVGNSAQHSITIIHQLPQDNILQVYSGQGQSASIFTSIAEPLTVQLLQNGNPVANKPVVFRVIEGDGVLQPGSPNEDRAALVITDNNGLASVTYQLGSRSGNGLHRVRARTVGFEGEALFHTRSLAGTGNKVGVIAGNNQRGAIRQPLALPFVVAVTDQGSNLIEGASIAFSVVEGGGRFDNGEAFYLTTTDKDGRATAHLTLGITEGRDQHRVIASLEGTAAVAGFTASGLIPGDPGNTSISGVVLDNQDSPLPGVVVRIDDANRQAITDDQGLFTINNTPYGPILLIAEGNTTIREGEWPTLSFEEVVIAGANNTLASPIYLVELNTEGAEYVGAEDKVLTHPKLPGFKLKVDKNTVTFPDGSKQGLLSITPVNANKIPMPPPNGMQPQLIVTIQPHGAVFDPPAELTLPNVDGHRPGAEVEMYSYDHDLEEFVTIGLGTVSKDGSIITSNTGTGVIKAGWHCGSVPGETACTHDCGDNCSFCDDNGCVCKPDPEKDNRALDAVKPCTYCIGGISTFIENGPTPDLCWDCKDGDLVDKSIGNPEMSSDSVYFGATGSVLTDGFFHITGFGYNSLETLELNRRCCRERNGWSTCSSKGNRKFKGKIGPVGFNSTPKIIKLISDKICSKVKTKTGVETKPIVCSVAEFYAEFKVDLDSLIEWNRNECAESLSDQKSWNWNGEVSGSAALKAAATSGSVGASVPLSQETGSLVDRILEHHQAVGSTVLSLELSIGLDVDGALEVDSFLDTPILDLTLTPILNVVVNGIGPFTEICDEFNDCVTIYGDHSYLDQNFGLETEILPIVSETLSIAAESIYEDTFFLDPVETCL
jgi:hypothetical protein